MAKRWSGKTRTLILLFSSSLFGYAVSLDKLAILLLIVRTPVDYMSLFSTNLVRSTTMSFSTRNMARRLQQVGGLGIRVLILCQY